jgi:hypothetical protein
LSASSILARGRLAAEALMVDTCTIKRVTGRTTDPETGQVTQTTTTVYGPGKCRVQQQGGISRPHDLGEAQVFLVRLEVQLPVDTSIGVQPDDLVTVLSSSLDPDLPGRVFYVRELAHKTHATARRIQVEEVTG